MEDLNELRKRALRVHRAGFGSRPLSADCYSPYGILAVTDELQNVVIGLIDQLILRDEYKASPTMAVLDGLLGRASRPAEYDYAYDARGKKVMSLALDLQSVLVGLIKYLIQREKSKESS